VLYIWGPPIVMDGLTPAQVMTKSCESLLTKGDNILGQV
jgi:hypothetical protein